jgi:hypothetical protein
MDIFEELNFPVVYEGPQASYGSLKGGGFFIDAPADVTWSVDISRIDWITLYKDKQLSGKGPYLFFFSVKPNEGEEREGDIFIRIGNQRRKRTIKQQSGAYIKSAGDSVLDLPFIKCPRVMEFAILFKWITEMVKKIPQPWRLIAIAVVEVVILIGGFAFAAVIEALKGVVPVESTPFTWPDMPSHSSIFKEPYSLAPIRNKTSTFDVSPSLIVMQTAVSAIYVAWETLL